MRPTPLATTPWGTPINRNSPTAAARNGCAGSSAASSRAMPVNATRSRRSRIAARIARGPPRIQLARQEDDMIRKLTSGEYRLYSRKTDPKTGRRRNLGTFKSRAAAEKHEREVQYFKRH